VDRARGVVVLGAEQTKTDDEPRDVRLNDHSDAVLARHWKDGAEWVFASQNWNRYRSAWDAAVKRAKLTNLRFHDLRHTFASWLVQKGRPLKEVQEALGHKTLIMALRYAHLAPDNLRAAAASLDPTDRDRLLR
jgi:integrase